MNTTNSISASTSVDGILVQLTKMGHEQVLFCNDAKTGLKAIIAVHNTVLGPALGGTRMWMYNNEADALNDVLRLSRGMTYKNSISGLDLGGGKAVIIGDSRTMKSEALLRRFGQFVNSLSGKYITAEDMGISPEDMVHVSKETNYVVGLPGKSGDPSPVTAYGVYMGMKAAAKYKFGSDNLAGKKVLVQGTGHVGETLISYLTKEGAIVFVSDIHQDKMENMVTKYGAHIFTGADLYSADVDIYSPCALGATINDDTVYKIKAKVIAGAANNQLAVENIHGSILRERGIAYAPDFLINAGGIINVYGELVKYPEGEAMRKTENIYNTTLEIFSFADINNLTTQQAAMQIAQNIIDQRKKENASK